MKEMNTRSTVYAKNGDNGLDIFLNISGIDHYLTTRRRNGILWDKLHDGITLGELKRIKPQKNPFEQKYYHAVCYLLKIADDYIQHELVA